MLNIDDLFLLWFSRLLSLTAALLPLFPCMSHAQVAAAAQGGVLKQTACPLLTTVLLYPTFHSCPMRRWLPLPRAVC